MLPRAFDDDVLHEESLSVTIRPLPDGMPLIAQTLVRTTVAIISEYKKECAVFYENSRIFTISIPFFAGLLSQQSQLFPQ
ncbi:hypothetical protein SDC9_177043 [bioreactor metagenome]|uniref:Uncharacterized protein n=1 Tax=bioreactor metagenome TaxID=1076179 RepID=A0A645GTH0_9ZZZZ